MSIDIVKSAKGSVYFPGVYVTQKAKRRRDRIRMDFKIEMDSNVISFYTKVTLSF